MPKPSEGARHVISLGGGVQSSTMALMAAHGQLEPMPVAAVFADTQAEPRAVYDWLDTLEPLLPYPVHRVSQGDLGAVATTVRVSKGGNKYIDSAVPAYIEDSASGRVGMLMRQCTADFKIAAINREVRRIVGKAGHAVQWIGISTDEAHRMKPSRVGWIENRWPLIEKRMTRAGCIAWLLQHNYPQPPRSACVFCPYHSDKEWARLKRDDPDGFERAAAFEDRLAVAVESSRSLRGRTSLHRSLVPLRDAVFSDTNQPDLFGNECEGVCGV